MFKASEIAFESEEIDVSNACVSSVFSVPRLLNTKTAVVT